MAKQLKLVTRIKKMKLDKELEDKLVAEIEVVSKTVKGFLNSSFLTTSFSWSESPSGWAFWTEINDKYFKAINTGEVK